MAANRRTSMFGEMQKNDSSANVILPVMAPIMSTQYAFSGDSLLKVSPMMVPIENITANGPISKAR